MAATRRECHRALVSADVETTPYLEMVRSLTYSRYCKLRMENDSRGRTKSTIPILNGTNLAGDGVSAMGAALRNAPNTLNQCIHQDKVLLQMRDQ